jgi:signal peptidase I
VRNFDKLEKNLADGDLYESCFRVKERKSNAQFFLVILGLLIFFTGLRFLWVQTFAGIVVDGASMRNTLSDGDQLIMRYANVGEPPKHGDVIIVDTRGYPECGNTKFLVKRLIAMEGDKVRAEDGIVYVCYAGETEYVRLEEDYAYYCFNKADYDFREYVVGKGEIFFLGDNRQNSKDSRYGLIGGSHLEDRLYKLEDIYGVIPSWAIENKGILETIFFRKVN